MNRIRFIEEQIMGVLKEAEPQGDRLVFLTGIWIAQRRCKVLQGCIGITLGRSANHTIALTFRDRNIVPGPGLYLSERRRI